MNVNSAVFADIQDDTKTLADISSGYDVADCTRHARFRRHARFSYAAVSRISARVERGKVVDSRGDGCEGKFSAL